MLYSISGAQGCGKSVLLGKLHTQFGYNVIERKTASSILHDWNLTLSQVYDNDEIVCDFHNELIQRKWLDEYQLSYDANNIWLTERSFMDIFTYATILLGGKSQYNDWLNNLYEQCIEYQHELYTQVFYIPSNKFVEVDGGMRSNNKHFSKLVDLFLLDNLKSHTNTILLDDANSTQFIHEVITITSQIKVKTHE